MVDQSLVALAQSTAVQFGLNPLLVCALVEQESSWIPRACRSESAFYLAYIVPLKLPDPVEASNRAISYGLLQILGETARELGFTGAFPDLLDPAQGLFWGCKKFAKCAALHPDSVINQLLCYNGGARPEYAAEVLNRVKNYELILPPPDSELGR